MLSSSILRDPGGAPLYYISQIEDITERKRVEKELRDANAFLDAIIENIPIMLFIKESASLRFVRFNRAGEDLLGWSRQSLVGKNDFDFWPREQAEFFVQKDRETMKLGKVVEIDEEPIQTRHQGVRILHTKKVPILDPSGNPLYLLGISEDITERRRIEKERRLLAEVSVALSASLDYEQTLATVTRVGRSKCRRLVRHRCDGGAWAHQATEGRERRRCQCGALYRSSSRCRPTEISLISPGPCSRADDPSSSSTSRHSTSSRLRRGRNTYRPSGPRGHVAHRGAALDAGRAPRRACCSDPRTRIASTGRTIFVGPKLWLTDPPWPSRTPVSIELRSRQRSCRDQVLGVVAHDLRNPLSTILHADNGSEVETSSQSRPALENPIEVIHRAATRMNRLIQDLLDVSLIETGQLTIQRARLSGGELVVEAVETQKLLASVLVRRASTRSGARRSRGLG